MLFYVNSGQYRNSFFITKGCNDEGNIFTWLLLHTLDALTLQFTEEPDEEIFLFTFK